MISWPNTTCTSWKRRPMMRARRNSGRICSGVALVATSKSGFQPDDQVAHGAADDIRVIAVLAQHLADLDGMARDVAAVDAVLVAGDAQRSAISGREQAADEFLWFR